MTTSYEARARLEHLPERDLVGSWDGSRRGASAGSLARRALRAGKTRAQVAEHQPPHTLYPGPAADAILEQLEAWRERDPEHPVEY